MQNPTTVRLSERWFFWSFLSFFYVFTIYYIINELFTIWLFNIAMENPPIFKFGKPSISMGHLYHGYVSHNQRVYVPLWLCSSPGCRLNWPWSNSWKRVAPATLSGRWVWAPTIWPWSWCCRPAGGWGYRGCLMLKNHGLVWVNMIVII